MNLDSLYNSVVSRDVFAHIGTGSVTAGQLLAFGHLALGWELGWLAGVGFPFVLLITPPVFVVGVALVAVGNLLADAVLGSLSATQQNLQELYEAETLGRVALEVAHAATVGRANTIRYLFQGLLGLAVVDALTLGGLLLWTAWQPGDFLNASFCRWSVPAMLMTFLAVLLVSWLFGAIADRQRKSYLRTLSSFCAGYRDRTESSAGGALGAKQASDRGNKVG